MEWPRAGATKGPERGDALRCARSPRHLDTIGPLSRLAEVYERALDAKWSERLQPLVDLTRESWPRRPRLSAVFGLPISLRNRIAHDQPSDSAFWEAAAAALRPLLQLQVEVAPLATTLLEPGRPAPWFLEQAGETLAFNGVSKDFAIRYVSRRGTSLVVEERGQATLQAFARLLGKADAQERDLRTLLSKLAPDDLKGVVLGDYLVGRPVGEGGFATVHVGRQLSTGRRVAVKILREGLEEDARARLQQEAALLSRFLCIHTSSGSSSTARTTGRLHVTCL